MIRVEYRPEVPEMRFAGHAGFAPAGNDIVCAGVSALYGALVMRLAQIEEAGGGTLSVAEEAGGWRVRFCSGGECPEPFQTVWTGLQLIAEEYPNHLEMRSVGCGERPVPDDKMRP